MLTPKEKRNFFLKGMGSVVRLFPGDEYDRLMDNLPPEELTRRGWQGVDNLTPEELTRRAWQGVGDSLRQAMATYDSEHAEIQDGIQDGIQGKPKTGKQAPPSQKTDDEPARRKPELTGHELIGEKQQSEVNSGPLPHPDLFKAYEKASPGAAERILQMTESNTAHAQKMGETKLHQIGKFLQTGQWFGLILGLSGITAAVIIALMATGEAAYFTSGIVGSTSMLVLFAAGWRKQK